MPDNFGVIEEISRRGAEELSVEWRISNFPQLLDGRGDHWYVSPTFRIGDEFWQLGLYLNWKREARNPASGWVELALFRDDAGPPATIRFCVGIRGSGGVEKSRKGEKKFHCYDGYDWDDFCSRSYLLEHRTRLMPEDTLTIRCVLKRPGTARDNDLLKKEVESFMEQIKTLEKTVENYELESQNYKKQISTLESEKLSIAEENKCLLEEKLTLEKEICDSKVRIDELQEINQNLVREKTKLDEEKSQYEIELKKLKESALFRNQDIVESEDRTSGHEREHWKDENSQSRSNTLSCDFSDLYADEVNPNFVLECNGWSIPVNTFVLSVRSNVFRDMFRNMVQENETGSADIKDLEVPVLMLMLKFLYCGKLEDVSEDTVADLYKAGDKYACSLKLACCQWMERNITQENCITFLKLADYHTDQDLRAAVVSFIISHLGVMKSTAWLTLSKERPLLANDVHQAYISSIIV